MPRLLRLQCKGSKYKIQNSDKYLKYLKYKSGLQRCIKYCVKVVPSLHKTLNYFQVKTEVEIKLEL